MKQTYHYHPTLNEYPKPPASAAYPRTVNGENGTPEPCKQSKRYLEGVFQILRLSSYQWKNHILREQEIDRIHRCFYSIKKIPFMNFAVEYKEIHLYMLTSLPWGSNAWWSMQLMEACQDLQESEKCTIVQRVACWHKQS